MTTDEQLQFYQFGCLSRCIIRASVLSRKPIKLEEFTNRYSKLFPVGQFGLLSLDKCCSVLTDLGLCDEVYSVRNVETAKKALANDQFVFVLTDLHWDNEKNELVEVYHSRLAIKWRQNTSSSKAIEEWELYSPKLNGTASDIWTSWDVLEQQLAHFLILA